MTKRACLSNDPGCTGLQPCDACQAAVYTAVLPWAMAAAGVVARESVVACWEGPVAQDIATVLREVYPNGLVNEGVVRAFVEEFTARRRSLADDVGKLIASMPGVGGSGEEAAALAKASEPSATGTEKSLAVTGSVSPAQPETPVVHVEPKRDPLDEPVTLTEVLETAGIPVPFKKSRGTNKSGRAEPPASTENGQNAAPESKREEV